MPQNELKYHFCYAPFSGKHLQQGDILNKTNSVKNILEDVHPHYLDKSYTHFIVLSQTCDLVRRNGVNCKARYITLGVVRPLSLVIEREIGKYQDDFDKAAMVCKNSDRSKLHQLLERLFNNNETEYFYIEPQPEIGLVDPSCAFLRLSISIRAYQHYDKCLEARFISLSEGFRAKLGWMLGNVYSRVGTEDWVPGTLSPKEFSAKIKDNLESSCQWVDDEKLKAIKTDLLDSSVSAILGDALKEYENIFIYCTNLSFLNVFVQLKYSSFVEKWLDFFEKFDFDETPDELLRALIQHTKVSSKKDDALQRIKEILKSSTDLEEEKLEKIYRRMASDSIISRGLS